MWPFKKSKPAPPQVKLWRVPDDKAEKFCILYDAMLQDGRRSLECLKFWQFVAEICAEGANRHISVKFINHYPHLEITLKGLL